MDVVHGTSLIANWNFLSSRQMEEMEEVLQRVLTGWVFLEREVTQGTHRVRHT